MNYEKDYIEKFNFKDYENTSILAYELIMRNMDCQKCFRKLHSIIVKINNKVKIYKEPTNRFRNDRILQQYISERWEIDKSSFEYSRLQNTFLKQLLNYFLILKGGYEKEEWAEYFNNYIKKKQEALLNDQYMNYSNVINSIDKLLKIIRTEIYEKDANIDNIGVNLIIKEILESYIASIGYKMMSRDYDDILVVASSSVEEYKVASLFQEYLDNELKNIGFIGDMGVDKSNRKRKKIIDEGMEPYYIKYRKNQRDIERFERLRHTLENHISFEFYIDFQQELYLDYSFYSQKLQNDLHIFYKDIQQKEYPELAIKTIASIQKEEVIKHGDFSLKLYTLFGLDGELMNKLSSIYLEEDLLKLIKRNPNENIFRYTSAKPLYSRPSLFSEKFRDITLTFNPNLSKKELVLQFENIIDLYQSNILKNKSIYETLGEEFGEWSKQIKRKTRDYNKKETSGDEKDFTGKNISTILNQIAFLLYVYDADKKGLSHIEKVYTTNESVGKVSSFLQMAIFLIEEKGYKILLSSDHSH